MLYSQHNVEKHAEFIGRLNTVNDGEFMLVNQLSVNVKWMVVLNISS